MAATLITGSTTLGGVFTPTADVFNASISSGNTQPAVLWVRETAGSAWKVAGEIPDGTSRKVDNKPTGMEYKFTCDTTGAVVKAYE